MFRVVDVQTTPLLELGSSNTLSGLASISYMLSKSMDAHVKIYDKGIIIPIGGQSSLGNACTWPPDGCVPVASPSADHLDCCIHYSTETVQDYYTQGGQAVKPEPIKEFKGTRQGEGYTITDYWDGYKIDPTAGVPTEMMPDGLYPYIIVASASLPGSKYYENVGNSGIVYPLNGKWHPLSEIYASDRVTGYITISRGPVYFSDIQIKPTHPTQYYSSVTVVLAP